MNSFKQQVFRYWLAMNASAFKSAVHATTFVGAASCMNQLNASVPAPDLKNIGLIFLVAFSRGIAAYLRDHDVTNVLAPALPTILKAKDALDKVNAELDTTK